MHSIVRHRTQLSSTQHFVAAGQKHGPPPWLLGGYTHWMERAGTALAAPVPVTTAALACRWAPLLTLKTTATAVCRSLPTSCGFCRVLALLPLAQCHWHNTSHRRKALTMNAFHAMIPSSVLPTDMRRQQNQLSSQNGAG